MLAIPPALSPSFLDNAQFLFASKGFPVIFRRKNTSQLKLSTFAVNRTDQQYPTMKAYFCTVAVSPWPVQITSMAFSGREVYRLFTLVSIRLRTSFSSEVTLYAIFLRPEGLLHVSNEIISAIFVFTLSSSSTCFLKYENSSENCVQTKCTRLLFT